MTDVRLNHDLHQLGVDGMLAELADQGYSMSIVYSRQHGDHWVVNAVKDGVASGTRRNTLYEATLAVYEAINPPKDAA